MRTSETIKGRKFNVLLALFSVWIIFHVIVFTVMPNGGSMMGRRLGNLIGPYSAVLGLNTSWNFFSPDPAHTMFIKFTIRYEDETGNTLKEAEEFYMPPEKDEGVADLSKRRELYAMRYMALDPRRVEAILGPWMCRTHQGASSVHIEHIINTVPSLDEATLFRGKTLESMSKEVEFTSKDYNCSHVNDEVSL